MKNANDNYAQCIGGGEVHKYNFGHVVTAGALMVAQDNGAFWFLDVITSYQFEKRFQDEEFQTWELYRRIKKDGTHTDSFLVRATDGNGNVLCEQKIPFSDFPHDQLKLWNVQKTIMLPTEY
jgi:hypothetical protein